MIAAFLAVYSQFLYDKEQRTTFASNTDFSHSIQGRAVLNGVLPRRYLLFYRYDSVALSLGCKLAVFNILIAVLLLVILHTGL